MPRTKESGTDLPRLVERNVDINGTRTIAFLRGPYRFEFEVGEETYSAMGDAENERLRAALKAIAENAEAWHGDDAAKGRSLGVIARTAREALERRP